jgi:hypothetical protein
VWEVQDKAAQGEDEAVRVLAAKLASCLQQHLSIAEARTASVLQSALRSH